MKILCASILFFCTQISFAQKERIDSLFKVFEKDIAIEQTYSDGAVVWDDDTKENYYLLMKAAPIDSLIKYVDNPNPAIRCIIFTELLKNHVDKRLLRKIVDNYRNDTAVYKTRQTCVLDTWRVNEYMKTFYKVYTRPGAPKYSTNYDKMLAAIRKDPRIVLPDIRHGIIPKEKIISIDSLAYNDKALKIHSFNVIFIRRSESEVEEVKNESNFFSAAIKERFLQLQSGDRLLLEEIRVLDKDGRMRILAPLYLRIE